MTLDLETADNDDRFRDFVSAACVEAQRERYQSGAKDVLAILMPEMVSRLNALAQPELIEFILSEGLIEDWIAGNGLEVTK